MSKLKFQELLLRHGMRHPDLIELADAKGITAAHDLETSEGREAAAKEFRRRSPGSFKQPEGMSMMSAMRHFGNAEGEDSQTEQRVREQTEKLLVQHIEAQGGEMPQPERPVAKMSAEELDRYQNKLLAWHTRAAAAAVEKAQVRRAVREIRYGGGL